MTAGIKPYRNLISTELPWLGLLPEHWELKRAKSSVQNIVEHTTQMVTGDVYVALENIESWTGRVRPQSGKYLFTGQVKKFRANDVLFGKLRPYLAKVTRLQCNGVCVGELFVLRPRGDSIRPDFLELQMRASHIIGVISSSTFGAKMPRADWQFVGTLPLVFPPPDEQAEIVRFLGWANRSLDKAIRAKRKVILLLNEQKQAIIHRGVTRGLDPAVPLKPSGIHWLGDVPAHWEALRSKYIFREVDNRSAAGTETHLSMSQKHGLIRSSEIEEKRLVSESYAGAKLCEQGDLVLNRLKAHLGVFALARESGLVSADYTVLRPVRDLEDRYFEAVYRTPACRVELRRRAKGIVQGFWRLYTDDFYDIRVPVPPLAEQKRIMAQLDVDLLAINTATVRLERETDLLAEYGARLIVDVVTGKLDVREAAARLPDEASMAAIDESVGASNETELPDEDVAA